MLLFILIYPKWVWPSIPQSSVMSNPFVLYRDEACHWGRPSCTLRHDYHSSMLPLPTYATVERNLSVEKWSWPPPPRLYRVPQKSSDGSSCCTVTTVNHDCQLCCSGWLTRSAPSISLNYIHVVAERAEMEKWLNANGMFKCFMVGLGSEYLL